MVSGLSDKTKLFKKGGATMLTRNQRGSVLVLVLVAAAALLTLGVTLSSVAFSDQSQAIRQQKNNEAYYIARSGAEAVEAVLLNDQQNINSYIGRTTMSELGNGNFEVEVADGGSGVILINSTGYSGKYSETVTLSLVSGDSGEPGEFLLPDFDMAVFASSKINLNSGSPVIKGDVATNTISEGVLLNNAGGYRVEGDLYIGKEGKAEIVVPNYPHKISGSIYELDLERLYPLPEFPEHPAELTFRGAYSTRATSGTITEDGYYPDFDRQRLKKGL